ncbi:hypothetical protein G9P44_001388 [Scheffersomyces stipitis]|nr:hypothetical protein G9P44_001388 [Scheffersomyces stipitis]
MLQQFDRIRIDNELATIKFIGALPAWGPTTTAFGIEWDRPERGKNNGELNGISYFKTDITGAGSFIKSSNKKIELNRQTFVQQLLSNYAVDSYTDQRLHFGSKRVEEYGLDKLNKIHANFLNLKSVTLDHKLIYIGYADDEKDIVDIFSKLANLAYLDLGFNLINDLSIVWGIIDRIPSLTKLILNGNRFFDLSKSVIIPHNLQSLHLSSTNISASQIAEGVTAKFPNLQELYLSGNNYQDEDVANLCLEDTYLDVLDLSLNAISVIPTNLKHIRSLILSDNLIRAISPDCKMEELKSIDLRRNQIQSLDFIDTLYLNLPRISELRINNNPVFEKMGVEEMTIQLIARFECDDHKRSSTKLFKLNGSLLNEDEISNAELYFISKVKQNEVSFKNEKRWKKLVAKHDIAEHFTDSPKSKRTTLSMIGTSRLLLQVQVEDKIIISRYFLNTFTVLRLKGLISKQLNNISVRKLQLHYYVNEFDKDSTLKVKFDIDDDISILDNFGFHENQTIYTTIEP